MQHTRLCMIYRPFYITSVRLGTFYIEWSSDRLGNCSLLRSCIRLRNRLLGQISQCSSHISHNAPFRTEMCKFLFRMVHCGTWDMGIVGFVNLLIFDSRPVIFEWTYKQICIFNRSLTLEWRHPFSWTKKTCLHNTVNTIPADDIATVGARASAATELTYFSQNILASALDGFITQIAQRSSMCFGPICRHYNDVTVGAIASQITSLTIVYSIVYSDADQRKHQSSASMALLYGNHRGPVNSPHKWPVKRKVFPFDDVIMETYVLYDATILLYCIFEIEQSNASISH